MSVIPPLGTLNGLPSTDLSNPYYLPPTGYYQNDAGALVPMNTPSSTSTGGSQAAPSTSSSSSPSLWQSLKNYETSTGAAKNAGMFGILGADRSLEDYVFIVLGLIVIIAGVFGFNKTQSVIVSAGTTAAKTVKGATEVVAA
jgi:hypothetical protein